MTLETQFLVGDNNAPFAKTFLLKSSVGETRCTESGGQKRKLRLRD
jgi:hypothetical protein